MLMLEMLFALWKGPKADEDDWAESGELPEQAKSWRSSFLTTRSAWKAWWKKCVHLFQSVHNEGAHKLAAELREKCRNTKQLVIEDHCELLRATVKKIAAPCAEVPEGEVYKKVSLVLQVASELINPAGKTQWQEIHRRLLKCNLHVGSNYSDEADEDPGKMLLRLVQPKGRGQGGWWGGDSYYGNYDENQLDPGKMLLRLVQPKGRGQGGWWGGSPAALGDSYYGNYDENQLDPGKMLLRLVQPKGRGQGGWWGGDSYYGNYEWADHRKGAGKYKHKGKTSGKHVWAGWNGSESWWTSTSGEEWLEESQNYWIGRQRSAPQWGRTNAPEATNARWRQKGKAEGKGSGSGKGKSKSSTAEPKAKQKWNPAAKSSK
ncbi:Src42A [Symbiodinium sp. CCMP2592]|nr:Src42A [Symbiodinium sp. CCMP2592]